MPHPLAFPAQSPATALARRMAARAAAAGVLALGVTLAVAQTASAHVSITPETASAGDYQTLSFRVPNESDQADVTQVEVRLPTDTPFTVVQARVIPGWTATVTNVKLARPVDVDGTQVTEAPSTVTWVAAEGNAVKPDQFAEFAILAGPLPQSEPLLFPTDQRYSDGTTVSWDQPTPASGPEPEHPAPQIVVTAATGEPEGSHGAGGHDASAPESTTADPLARGLAGAAVVIALAGLLLAVWRRGRAPR